MQYQTKTGTNVEVPAGPVTGILKTAGLSGTTLAGFISWAQILAPNLLGISQEQLVEAEAQLGPIAQNILRFTGDPVTGITIVGILGMTAAVAIHNRVTAAPRAGS